MSDTTTNTFHACCLGSFSWAATPTGTETSLANLPTYITGASANAAVLFVHDALGWKFSNARLLADHYAREANVTVYMPDFFGGEELDAQAICEGRWGDLDMAGFSARNARGVREPEMFAAARAVKEMGYARVGAVGFCFGGWAVLRLGAEGLVDAVVCAHPSWVVEGDWEGVGVPVMVLAPERDEVFGVEMKRFAFGALVRKGEVPFEWVHFPGVEHGCLTKGDEGVEGEREAMVKGKEAAVRWFGEWLRG